MEDFFNNNKPIEWLEILPQKGLLIKHVSNILYCFCAEHPLPMNPPLEHRPDTKFPANEVLVTGLGRSASTVTWQVADLLMGGKVAKSHDPSDSCPTLFNFKKVIITVRHPFDQAFSLKKTNGNKFLDIAKKEWDIIKNYYMLYRLQEAIGYRPDLQIVFLRYEDFWNKDEERIKYLANLLEKNITWSEIEDILLQTSIEKNLERSLSGNLKRKINVNHVDDNKGRPGQGKNLDANTKKAIIEIAGPAFDIFNYER